MTNSELKALRRFFFLDVKEAAEFIGNCSPRSWQRWETGQVGIPNDVSFMMNQLKEERKEIFSILSKDNSFVDFKTNSLIYTRLIESVKAELLAKMS